MAPLTDPKSPGYIVVYIVFGVACCVFVGWRLWIQMSVYKASRACPETKNLGNAQWAADAKRQEKREVLRWNRFRWMRGGKDSAAPAKGIMVAGVRVPAKSHNKS